MLKDGRAWAGESVCAAQARFVLIHTAWNIKTAPMWNAGSWFVRWNWPGQWKRFACRTSGQANQSPRRL